MKANYIIDIGKDITRLSLKFLDDEGIYHSKNAEDAMAKQKTCCVEDDIINIYGAEARMKYKRHDKLDELKRTADNNNEPWNTFRFDVSNEMNPKAKGHGKEDIIEDIFETILWQVVEARTKV